MFKKYLIPVSALVFALFLLAINPDQISYGVLYIENKTDWDLKVTAQVKDEWDVVTQTNWDISAHGAEKIDNLSKLSNIRFKPEIDDDSVTPDWLKHSHRLVLESHQPAKDLIVTISKDPYADRWKTDQLYVSSAKIEYGHVKILAR